MFRFLAGQWARFSPKQQQLISFAWRLIYTIVAALTLFGVVFIWFPFALQRAVFFPHNLPIDHRDYFTALQKLHSGASLYDNGGANGGYLYPPPFLALIYPLRSLDEPTFVRLWYSLMVAAFFVYAWCLARLVCPQTKIRHFLVACFVLTLFPGQIRSMSNGNFQPVLMALWGMAYAFNIRAIALAISTVVKIHTIFPLAVAFCDEWKISGPRGAFRTIVLPATLTFAVLIFAGGLLCGWATYSEWARVVPERVSQGTFYYLNVSLSIGVLRLLQALGVWHHSGGPLASGPRLFLTICSLGGPLWVWWMMRRTSPELRQSCVGSAVVLLAPLCWTYYLPTLLVPLAIWLRESYTKWQKQSALPT